MRILGMEFFNKLAKDVIPMYRSHIFIDAKDVFGEKFSSDYSSPYGELKAAGKLKRQSGSGKYNAPVVSGDLKGDWGKLQVTPNMLSFGTKAYGGRVKHLAENGRVISTDKKALPDHIANHVIKEAKKAGMKNVRKQFPKGTKTIKIRL